MRSNSVSECLVLIRLRLMYSSFNFFLIVNSLGDHSQDHGNTGLTLKCDLHECLLDPLHLPYQSCFVSTLIPVLCTSIFVTETGVKRYWNLLLKLPLLQ